VNTRGIVARSLRGYDMRAVLIGQIVTPESPVFTSSLASAGVQA
jgi:hypothetical protein